MKNAVIYISLIGLMGCINVIDAAAAAYIPPWATVGNGFWQTDAAQAFHIALWAYIIFICIIGVVYFWNKKNTR